MTKEITIDEVIHKEKERLNDDLEMIASENYPSSKILNILGSVLSVKYAEGYPEEISKQGRHYAGCVNIDSVEMLAINKAKELFGVQFANVQPMSGTHANTAVYHAFCKPGDKTLSMSLNSGAHLTHGSKFTYSGRFYDHHEFKLVNEKIDYDEIKKQLFEVKPRLLILGYSAYSHKIDFKKISEIVWEYNKPIFEADADTYEANKCVIWCDMAHFAGFIAAHVWDDKYDPTKYCDVITSTTHKTLRGPRGGIIIWNNPKYTNKINQAVFPGNAGGPNSALIAAKAQCFIEALQPEFAEYIMRVSNNMQGIIRGIKNVDEGKIRIVSESSENHLVLLDVKGLGITGKQAEEQLYRHGIVTNKNMIEGDASPSTCSGLRLGTAALTTRGLTYSDAVKLGEWIGKLLLNSDVLSLDFNNFKSELIYDKLKPVYDY